MGTWRAGRFSQVDPGRSSDAPRHTGIRAVGALAASIGLAAPTPASGRVSGCGDLISPRFGLITSLLSPNGELERAEIQVALERAGYEVVQTSRCSSSREVV
jgi:hypothetical protein